MGAGRVIREQSEMTARSQFSVSNRRAVLGGMAGALSSGIFSPAFARAAKPSPSPTLIEAMADMMTPGMAAIVIRDFRAEHEMIAGARRLGRDEQVRVGDRWHLGSNGKAITATLIARLVEKGVLSWDAPLVELLPQFSDAMQQVYRDVTLPELLSHRAGLPENHEDMNLFNSFYEDAASTTEQRLRYLDAALRDDPVGPVRGESSYSNTGYLLAAAAAERATGEPFEDLIIAEVYHPLGISSVSFEQFGGEGEPSGHVDGRIAEKTTDANPRMFAPAGGMRMTMADWSKFCIDQLRGEHGDGRLLKEENYRFLHAPQGETRAALGWGASPTVMGLQGPAVVHSGSDGNWMALVALFSETGNGVLVAANAGDSMGGDVAAKKALKSLATSVADAAPAN